MKILSTRRKHRFYTLVVNEFTKSAMKENGKEQKKKRKKDDINGGPC